MFTVEQVKVQWDMCSMLSHATLTFHDSIQGNIWDLHVNCIANHMTLLDMLTSDLKRAFDMVQRLSFRA